MTGNTQMIREMKRIVEDGQTLDVRMRDRLFLQGLIDIYEKMDQISIDVQARENAINTKFEKFQPVFTFYKVGMFFASAMGISIIGFIGALLTGQVELTFK